MQTIEQGMNGIHILSTGLLEEIPIDEWIFLEIAKDSLPVILSSFSIVILKICLRIYNQCTGQSKIVLFYTEFRPDFLNILIKFLELNNHF